MLQLVLDDDRLPQLLLEFSSQREAKLLRPLNDVQQARKWPQSLPAEAQELLSNQQPGQQ